MNVGFIGVGLMGGPMCLNLIKKGHEAVVYDLSAKALAQVIGSGAVAAGSPKAVAEQVDVVFTSLPMPADVEQVIMGENGIAAGAQSGTTIVDMSTNAPAVVKRLSEALSAKGIALIDAPVSGGLKGAKEGTLAIMCGGKQADFDAVKPLLECMGANVFLVGDIGSGSIAKLCNNMTFFSNLAVACEALMLATRAGLNPKVMADVMEAASGNSVPLPIVARKGLEGNWDPEFSLNLSHKDLTLALELGTETGTHLNFGSQTFAVFQQARAQGWGGDDIVGILRLWEQAMGTEVRK